MEPAEIDVLKAFLHPEVVMFEFGAGVLCPTLRQTSSPVPLAALYVRP